MIKNEDWLPAEYWELESNDHGGECCGRKHLLGFPDVNDYLDEDKEVPSFAKRVEGLRQLIQKDFKRNNYRPDCGLCVEVVLVDRQKKLWGLALNTIDFKQVFSFRNQNSGNVCYVYLLDTTKLK